jgi:hypothetical protein
MARLEFPGRILSEKALRLEAVHAMGMTILASASVVSTANTPEGNR